MRSVTAQLQQLEFPKKKEEEEEEEEEEVQKFIEEKLREAELRLMNWKLLLIGKRWSSG